MFQTKVRAAALAIAVLGLLVVLPASQFSAVRVADAADHGTQTAGGQCTGNGDPQAEVTINDGSFSPASVTLGSGNHKVRWTSNSLFAHTVTDDDATPEYDSGLLTPLRYTDTFQVIFCSSGTYNYKCLFHDFTATIVVS
ncbi:MAG TPA: hypothetical protein VGR28_08530 [Candidatus Thermoplasmatota archaeon]|jgi:plastocyanin|nr:hypothetical protein [Candidatus Thermoplasmatota archaeon]